MPHVCRDEKIDLISHIYPIFPNSAGLNFDKSPAKPQLKRRKIIQQKKIFEELIKLQSTPFIADTLVTAS